jgi:transcriptional regulator with XRE-family HTH domain
VKSPKIERNEVGERLREFAKARFKGLAGLARALEMSPQQLSNYVAGRVAPGLKLQMRLEALGCDSIWLITGRDREAIEEGFDLLVQRRSLGRKHTKRDDELLTVLHVLGVRSTEELFPILDEEMALAQMKRKGVDVVDAMKMLDAFRRRFTIEIKAKK